MTRPRKAPPSKLKLVPSRQETVPSPQLEVTSPALEVPTLETQASSSLESVTSFSLESDVGRDSPGKLGSPLTTPARGGKNRFMELENAGELVALGSDIVRLGAELKMARGDAEEAVARVRKLEGELQPRLIRHAQLIQHAAGLSFGPTPSLTTTPPTFVPQAPALPDWAPPIAKAAAQEEALLATAPPVAPAPLQQNPNTQLKARVKQYLKTRKSDEGISASDVAEYLHIDALIVREAMREIQTGR